MSAEPLSAEELEHEREDHRPTVHGPEGSFCGECDYRWPCPTDRLLATLDRDRERLAVLEGALDEFLTPIEGGFAHWEHDHPVTGEHLSGDPKVVILDRETWLPKTVALRAALKGATS